MTKIEFPEGKRTLETQSNLINYLRQKLLETTKSIERLLTLKLVTWKHTSILGKLFRRRNAPGNNLIYQLLLLCNLGDHKDSSPAPGNKHVNKQDQASLLQ